MKREKGAGGAVAARRHGGSGALTLSNIKKRERQGAA